MEIEFKLSCTPDTALALGRHLTRLTGAAPHKLQLQNTYYDTPNQDLRAQGIALRIRKQGRLKLQTVKCAGIVSGGLSSRPEWETPYGGRFDFSAVDVAEVRHTLEALAHLPGYRATLDTDFSRHVWHWRPEADTDIEIVIDRGRIVAGAREEAICEIELELVSGEPARLLDLVALLGTVAPLFPAPLSKATRGSRLLSAPPPPAPITVSHAQHCHAAFNALAQACLNHISINLPANCAYFSDDNLHQVRVGLRRLRALLQMFRPLMRDGWPRKAIADGARQHMQALAHSRELHVLQHEVVTPAANTLEPRAEQALRKQVDAMHKRAFAAAETHLLTQAFSTWLLHTSLALHAQPLRHKAGTQAWPAQAEALLAKQITAYSKQLKRTQPEPTSLHALRKHGKHLRYQLAVSGLHPAAGKALAQLQETLGGLNDLYVAGDIFGCLPATHADSIADIAKYHLPRHTKLQLRAANQLKQLRRTLHKLPAKSWKNRI